MKLKKDLVFVKCEVILCVIINDFGLMILGRRINNVLCLRNMVLSFVYNFLFFLY